MVINIDQDKSMTVAALRLCFYLTLASNLIIFIAQPLDIMLLETLASRTFMLSNMVAFFVVINKNIKHCIPNKTFQIITILIMTMASYISYLLSSNVGMYQYIIRIWCYLALPFYLIYIEYLVPTKRMIHIVFHMNFLITLVFILLSISNYKYAGYENFMGTSGAWLTLGYDNPNQTAMYLLITMIILYCAFHYYTNKIARFLILIDIIYMARLLYQTSSRTSIIIGLLITAIIMIKKKNTIPNFMVVIILLLPAVVMFVYPFLYDRGWIYIFEFGGKTDYASRSYIFSSVLSSVKDRILFGDFGTNQLQNVHNGTLSVYSSLGLAGLLLFYIYYFKAYFSILSNEFKSRTAYISFIGLLAIFIHACTEGAFIVGGSMYAGTLSVLVFLSKVDFREV